MGIKAIITDNTVLLYDPKQTKIDGSELAMGLQQYIKNHQDQTHGFELIALEAILIYVCERYRRRLLLYYPIVRHLISELQINVYKKGFDVRRLLTVTNALHNIQKSLEEFRNTLMDVLSDDNALLDLRLTPKKKANNDPLPLEMHEPVEILLETYLHQVTKLCRQAEFLRGTLTSTQELLALTLDSVRNKHLQLSIRINVLLASCTVVSTVGAVFGMNLLSGLEEVPDIFWMTV
eukprot:UN24575